MKRGSLTFAVIAGGIAVVMLWWSSAVVTTSGSAIAIALGELVGMLGGYLVCLQVLLIARVPWLERGIGLDRLVAWHRVVGTATVLLIVAHVCLMVLGQWAADGGGPVSAYLALFGLYPDMLTASIGTGLILLVGVTSASLLKRALPYEVWYWTHVSTYVAIYLTFLHQIGAGPAFVGHPVANALWLMMFLTVGACALVWRVVTPLVRFGRHRFEVAAVVPESARMTSVWIRARHLSELEAGAGQFMLFRFLARGHLLTAHPYSISNVPDGEYLRITVADLGDHSRALRELAPGTKVMVEGPFGGFIGSRAAGGVLLIAGGAGIGPIRGLAEQFARMGRSVVVIYRVSDVSELALYGEFTSLPGVRIVPLIGRRAQLGFDPLHPSALVQSVPDAHTREAFVCGPEGMISAAAESLRLLGIPAARIHFEEMSLT